jgi:hypothetical protein
MERLLGCGSRAHALRMARLPPAVIACEPNHWAIAARPTRLPVAKDRQSPSKKRTLGAVGAGDRTRTGDIQLGRQSFFFSGQTRHSLILRAASKARRPT